MSSVFPEASLRCLDTAGGLTEMKKIVTYVRVSTEGQGRSGLGLDAQRAAIARFAEVEGFEIAAEFTEVETGKGADALDKRPDLRAHQSGAGCGEGAWVGSRQSRLGEGANDAGSWRPVHGCYQPASGLRSGNSELLV